ncbi:hypothetical protein DY000_02034466 [Brassica cretica]|uniref:Endoplasmic reticulum transmembrane protein n=1 Tax=Brassica cretica TaxID=69181 RepID=A0ABQ7DM13_BRACR|nr:hypothetical protein DY000_02034466 [Brassica cretica]
MGLAASHYLQHRSALLLDGISVTALLTALVIYATRVVLDYKQTSYRYQALYEKTLDSVFGSVHILLDASEQQQERPQYKEALQYKEER